MRIKRRVLGVAIVFATVAIAGCSASSSAGSCVEPSVQASLSHAAPGDVVAVTGRFWQPCNDTNHSSDPPWPEVTLSWIQDGRESDEQRILIDDGAFAGEFEIPASAIGGNGSIQVRSISYTGKVDLQISPSN